MEVDPTAQLTNVPLSLLEELHHRLGTPLPEKDWVAIGSALDRAVMRAAHVVVDAINDVSATKINMQTDEADEIDIWREQYGEDSES